MVNARRRSQGGLARNAVKLNRVFVERIRLRPETQVAGPTLVPRRIIGALVRRLAPRGSRRRRLAATVRRPLRRQPTKPAPASVFSPYTDPGSVLVRHVLLVDLFGSEFDHLVMEEWQFCVDAAATVRHYRNDRTMPTNPITHWEGTYEQTWAKLAAQHEADRLRILEISPNDDDPHALGRYGLDHFVERTRAGKLGAKGRLGRYDWMLFTDLRTPLSPRTKRDLAAASRFARRGVIVDCRGDAAPVDEVRAVLSARTARVETHNHHAALKKYGFKYWPDRGAATVIATGRR